MSIITIQNLCNYLEEIGIIDQRSATPFLTLYSHAVNKNNNYFRNGNPFYLNDKCYNINIYENVLCAYLKKIFNIEKNFRIFSRKIIEKFKQNYVVKQYNGLHLLFILLLKKLNYYKVDSYYKIKILSNLYENDTENEIYYQDDESILKNQNNFNTEENYYINKNKNIIDSITQSCKNYRVKTINNASNSITIQSNKDKFNKSVDFKKHLKWYNNKSNNIKTDIQLENKKNKFLKQIKKEHNINFKRNKSSNNFERRNSNYNINSNNSKNINYIKYNVFQTDTNKEIDDCFLESGRNMKNSAKKEENFMRNEKKKPKYISNGMMYRKKNNKKNNKEENIFRRRKEKNFINSNDIQRMREQLDVLTEFTNEVNFYNK